MTPEERIQNHLAFLYGKESSNSTWRKLRPRLEDFRNQNRSSLERAVSPTEGLTQGDSMLITYGDQIREPGRPPLQTLADFLEQYLAGVITTVHLLPFYPFSSDDGFSVTDYLKVNHDLGTWKDVDRIGQNFRLMFDAVINHVSRKSLWFQGYLRDEKPYNDFFITLDPDATDLSKVVRPRTHPLLSPVDTVKGTRHVWTTFSEDEIDLNYANPQVLLEIIDVLLFYVAHGADVIRLDAIAYLWKEIGSACIHHPKTDAVVKLFRAILDAVAPWVLLLTETNVPHDENIRYFGEPIPGTRHSDEANLVYQFPLPPLVVHAFQTGNARLLSEWADSLKMPFSSSAFVNLLASHDGIGLPAARDLLREEHIRGLVDRTLAHGGDVSYRINADGSLSEYELNITLFDILNNPHHPQPEVDVRRFMAAQVIMLSLAGIPAIYVHSLVGSRNFHPGVEETDRARSINREKFDKNRLVAELDNRESVKYQVFQCYLHLLRQRSMHSAFHPHGEQRVLFIHDALFSLVRTAPDSEETVLCAVNVSGEGLAMDLSLRETRLPRATVWRDLIGEVEYRTKEERLSLQMKPYQPLWLCAQV